MITAEPKRKKYAGTDIKEGPVRRGGVKPKPTREKPDLSPPGQQPLNKGKEYVPFEGTLAKLQTALDAYKRILNDRILLDMNDRKIMGRAEALLRELIAKPTAARLRELKSGPRNPHSPFREKGRA